LRQSPPTSVRAQLQMTPRVARRGRMPGTGACHSHAYALPRSGRQAVSNGSAEGEDRGGREQWREAGFGWLARRSSEGFIVPRSHIGRGGRACAFVVLLLRSLLRTMMT